MSDTYQEIKVIEKIINNMEKLFYSPYIYKICTLKPEDIYDLFYGTPYLTLEDDDFFSNKLDSVKKKKDELFNIIINFIYVDAYYFDIIIKPEDYFSDKEKIEQKRNTYTGSYKNLLNDIDKAIDEDSKKYLSMYQLAENKNKTNTNEYKKNPKRIFIKTFIKLMIKLLDKYKETNNENDKFILKVIYQIISNINLKKIYHIYHNKFKNSNLIDKKILKYSKDNILTYIKVRNTNVPIDNYNRYRFDVTGYGDLDKDYADTLFLKYKNDNEKKEENEIYDEPSTGYTNHYFFGPFNRIFFYNESNKDVANNITDVKESLINGKNVFIIGYGASGSGKTSTLVYLKTLDGKTTEDGIIVYICKNMKDEYDTFKVKCFEISSLTEELKDTGERMIPSDQNHKLIFKNVNNELLLQNDYEHNPIWIDKGSKKKFTSGTKMGDMILYMIDDDRYIRPTTNNPKSSRSHYIIFIEMLKEGDENKKATLIVGDFAGVENKFNCQENNIVDKYFNIGNKENENNFKNYYTENFEKYHLEHLTDDKFNVDDKKYKLIPTTSDNLSDNFINGIFQNFIKLSGQGLKFAYYDSLNNSVKNINSNVINSNVININDYNNSVKNILINLFNSIGNKENENIMEYIKKIIDEFIEKINNLKKGNAKKICSNYFLLNKKDIITDNKKDIIELINFSKFEIIQYLSLYRGSDETVNNSFIYYLISFLNDNKEKLYNHWAKIFNNIIEEQKNKDEKKFIDTDIINKESKKKDNEKSYILEECQKRVNEGYFINESLSDLRTLITYILKEKNKDKISISPQFLNECFEFYCTKKNCFELGDVSQNINGKILNILKKNNINIEELIMCVFCVLNISPNANNPPPVKYIDINNIKKEFFDKMNTYDKENFRSFSDLMKKHFDKYTDLNTITYKDTFTEKLKTEKYLKSEYNRYKQETKNYIEYIDKYNAITSIGTLEFVDKISKFNLTNIICNIENDQAGDTA